jgi:hypothetical protein
LLLSVAQETYDDPEHVLPAVLQPDGVVHVHDAEPWATVQLWFVGHIAGGPYTRQPASPVSHVARPPPGAHDFCPCVQLLEHVDEHMALGAIPEHVKGEAHGEVDATKKQPSVSLAHVATVCMSWQTEPVSEQIEPLQAHVAPASGLAVHVWLVPHVCVVTQSRQPAAPAWHACASLPVHCVVPAVQRSTHEGASPESLAAPESLASDPEAESAAGASASDRPSRGAPVSLGSVASGGVPPSPPSFPDHWSREASAAS